MTGGAAGGVAAAGAGADGTVAAGAAAAGTIAGGDDEGGDTFADGAVPPAGATTGGVSDPLAGGMTEVAATKTGRVSAPGRAIFAATVSLGGRARVLSVRAPAAVFPGAFVRAGAGTNTLNGGEGADVTGGGTDAATAGGGGTATGAVTGAVTGVMTDALTGGVATGDELSIRAMTMPAHRRFR